jgi:hypothetical protein
MHIILYDYTFVSHYFYSFYRLRKGGIKLDEEATAEKKEGDYNKELAGAIEEEKREKKQEDEKKKADSLWADFMKDTGAGNKTKADTSGSGLGSLSSISQKVCGFCAVFAYI